VIAHVAIIVLLAIGAVAVWIGVLGVLLMPGFYNRLHFMGITGTVGVTGVTVAVLVQEHLRAAGIKTLLIIVILLVMNPVLTHATARAARTRQFGDWRLQPNNGRGRK
jgi:multicomponent Na+:H+ antiporter subunit G